jgi:hypothetical protein
MMIIDETDASDSDEFDTLFAVAWCGLNFSFIEQEDAQFFRMGIIHAKSFPDYPPEDEGDRRSAYMVRGFNLFWKMRYFYAAQKEHFNPDIPLIIVRDAEEIKAQKNKRENMIPDMFDFMR